MEILDDTTREGFSATSRLVSGAHGSSAVKIGHSAYNNFSGFGSCPQTGALSLSGLRIL